MIIEVIKYKKWDHGILLLILIGFLFPETLLLSKGKYIYASKPRIWYRIFGISTRFPANDVYCLCMCRIYTRMQGNRKRKEWAIEKQKWKKLYWRMKRAQKGNLLLFHEIFLTEKIAISRNLNFMQLRITQNYEL